MEFIYLHHDWVRLPKLSVSNSSSVIFFFNNGVQNGPTLLQDDDFVHRTKGAGLCLHALVAYDEFNLCMEFGVPEID
jgi:hypothetical protein